MKESKIRKRDEDRLDINDPLRFNPYTLISCLLAGLAGFFSLVLFNIIFTTRPELIHEWSDSSRNQFVCLYFLIPIAEIIAILLAIRAKKKREFWFGVAIAMTLVSSLCVLFIYIMGGNYMFEVL